MQGEMEMQTVVVVIVEEDGYRLGETLDEAAALTLVAVASEDPVCWDDVVACWPRYRTPPVPECADSLALERVDFAAARGTLDRHESWVVIDLVHRVPRGAGVAIAGMTERESETHEIDCDCPICNMMADGTFGPAFAGIDSHHLELDDEFAFFRCTRRPRNGRNSSASSPKCLPNLIANRPSVQRASRLQEQLEATARRYPQLVARLADLQSRFDEQVRIDEM